MPIDRCVNGSSRRSCPRRGVIMTSDPIVEKTICGELLIKENFSTSRRASIKGFGCYIAGPSDNWGSFRVCLHWGCLHGHNVFVGVCIDREVSFLGNIVYISGKVRSDCKNVFDRQFNRSLRYFLVHDRRVDRLIELRCKSELLFSFRRRSSGCGGRGSSSGRQCARRCCRCSSVRGGGGIIF